jgi:uncharacterized protein (TIGR02270 family)
MALSTLEQHALEAAFLWHLRASAATDPHYDLTDLAKLDERVEAQVDGLRIGGDEAWEIASAALVAEEPGEFFAASVIATDRGDLRGIARILDLGGGEPELQHGIVGGLEWLSFESVSRVLPGLLDDACPEALHWLGIAACAAHRKDPGPALDRALFSSDARLRARALQAVGELGRKSLLREIRGELASTDEACRFAAAWSLTLAGESDTAAILFEIAERGGKRALAACGVAVRSADLDTSKAWLRALGSRAEGFRLAIAGAGMLGDPELVPWLLGCMEHPTYARVAGESFTLITGADLVRERLRGKPPEDFKAGPSDDPRDENVDMDPDENLPWPNVAAVKRWWDKNRGRFPKQTRHLLGKPISQAWCEEVLRIGYQRQRGAAAIELALASPGKPLFPWRGPAFHQARLLGR